MRLILADNAYLRDPIAIAAELVDEGSIKASSSGLELVASDSISAAMVLLKLLPACFKEIDVEGEHDIGLNLASLKQVLKRIRADELVSLELVEGRLQLSLRSAVARTFSLPLLAGMTRPRVPTLNFGSGATIVLPSELLEQAIADAAIVSESLQLVAEPGKLTISAEGELSRCRFEIGQDQAQISAAGKIRAKYSIDYLKKMAAAARLCPQVTLAFAQDYPLRLDYRLVDRIALTFLLAPREPEID